MLSLWPNLFDYAFIAPLVLRLALGVSLLALYLPVWRRLDGILGSLAGILAIAGFGLQPVALFVTLLMIESIWHERHPRLIALLLLGIALSLLLLGPGLGAIDLPL